MKEPDLGDLPEMLGVELRIAKILADRLFANAQDAQLAPGQYTVLSLIRLNPGINQSNLARCMFMDRSSMVPLLDRFEKKGWTERRPHAHDRRSHAIHLTERGREILDVADRKVRSLEAKIATNMGRSDRDQLLALTKSLQATLLSLDQKEES